MASLELSLLDNRNIQKHIDPLILDDSTTDPYRMPTIQSPSTNQNTHSSIAMRYMATLGSKSSVETTRNRLLKVSGILWPGIDPNQALYDAPWHMIRYEQVKYIQNHMLSSSERQYKNTYINNIIATLSGLLSFCCDHSLMDRADFAIAFKKSRLSSGDQGQRGLSLNADQIEMLLDAVRFSKTQAGRARDKAMLSMLYSCGLRSFELAKMKMKDIDIKSWKVNVKGKGNKEAIVSVPERFRHNLKDWLESYRVPAFENIAPTKDGVPLVFADLPFICRVHRSGKIMQASSLTTKSMIERIKSIAENSRLPDEVAKKIGTHDMRRSLAGNLLENSNDIRMVQRHLRHSTVSTTEIYDRRRFDSERAGLSSL